MKTIVTTNGVTLYDPENTRYETRMPLFYVGKTTAVLVGLEVARLPEDDGWRITTYDAKYGGGIQLTPKSLRTWEHHLTRMIAGEDDRLHAFVQGFGELPIQEGADGYMWADYLEAGKELYRLRIKGNAVTVLGHVSAALNELEGNGVDIGEPSKFYSEKAQPKLSSSNGITWK